ncbi:transmembrane protein 230 isoform X7 [Petromyzon marinus]|uniref:transmembrane protein 230 isoform X7 n=1 Tax=Petromyzon marinus TaxID=7757 RepID=UPI003F6E883F
MEAMSRPSPLELPCRFCYFQKRPAHNASTAGWHSRGHRWYISQSSQSVDPWHLGLPRDLPAGVRHFTWPQGAMSRRNGPTAAQPASSKVKYSKLPDSDDGYIDLQFKRPPPRVPYRAIALAAALFLIGSLLIIIGSLLLTGYIDTKYADRTWPVLTVGVLVFLPGVYHLRIAILAYRGTAGYSYDDIPDFSD